MTEELWFNSQYGYEIFLYSKASRPALGNTQTPFSGYGITFVRHKATKRLHHMLKMVVVAVAVAVVMAIYHLAQSVCKNINVCNFCT
jgi:hypothetical protein